MPMSNDTNQSVYRFYAPFYDMLFGRIFSPGRRRVIELMQAGASDQVLEVGIGTGLSIPLYSPEARVIGIDLSEAMLSKAEHRVTKLRMNHVSLLKMDAQHLAFADASMNKVALMYVASVVPDVARLFSEAKRVCCQGGDIFILNHFSSEQPCLRWLESQLDRVSAYVGFTPVFSPEIFLQDAETEFIHTEEVNMFSYWRIIHLRKR